LGDYDNDGNRELFINADYIKAGEINADLIKTGTINADLIKAGTINANDVTIINLKANNITGALSNAVTIGGWHISNSSIESYTNNSNQTTTYHMRLFSTD
jgi:hypothetical protein